MKEGNAGRKAGFWIVVGGGLLITAAVIALFNSRFGILDLREVVVQGNRSASAAEIVSAAQLYRGQSLLSLPIRHIRERIELVPWIKTVSLRRRLPHTLVISVEERVPIAVVSAPERCLVLGEGGVVVSTDCSLSQGLMEVVGVAVSSEEPGARILDPRALHLIERLAAISLRGLTVWRMEATDRGSIRLLTEQDVTILLGTLGEAASQLDRLAALCRRFDVGDYETIDLRFGGEAVLAPRKAVKR